VCVASDEERAVRALLGPVLADGLAGGGDVGVVERCTQRRAAVARGPERHPLRRIVRVRGAVVISGEQGVDVDEVFGLGRRSGAGVGRHADSRVAAAGREQLATAAPSSRPVP
jgi:hypothetical protein